MSYWQWAESVDGWIRANTTEKDELLSDVEAEELWALAQAGA